MVPVSGSSCDVFVAYLGLVELSNTFSLGTNTESQQPVFEKDTLQLSKLSLYRWVHYLPLEAGLPFCALACIRSCSSVFEIMYFFYLLHLCYALAPPPVYVCMYRSVYQMGAEDPLLCKRHILQDSWRLCVTMQRNLSNAWYKADNTPYIALEAHISELKVMSYRCSCVSI